MSVWKSGFVAAGLLTVGLGTAVVLGGTAPGGSAPVHVADQQEAKWPEGGGVRVQVRAPYVNLDIRW